MTIESRELEEAGWWSNNILTINSINIDWAGIILNFKLQNWNGRINLFPQVIECTWQWNVALHETICAVCVCVCVFSCPLF